MESDDEEEDDEEAVQCQVCQDVPDNYISLNCKDNFCLSCMARHFVQNNLIPNQNGTVSVKCQFCEYITNLDPKSV